MNKLIIALIVALSSSTINPAYAIEYLENSDYLQYKTTTCVIKGKSMELRIADDEFVKDRKILALIDMIQTTINQYKENPSDDLLVAVINMLVQLEDGYSGDLTLNHGKNIEIMVRYENQIMEYGYYIEKDISSYYCNRSEEAMTDSSKNPVYNAVDDANTIMNDLYLGEYLSTSFGGAGAERKNSEVQK